MFLCELCVSFQKSRFENHQIMTPEEINDLNEETPQKRNEKRRISANRTCRNGSNRTNHFGRRDCTSNSD